MAVVMIGIDPHKGSHTALALDPDEVTLGQIRVRASSTQVENLLSWSAPWPDRIWAIEGATGLGRLLAQQLLAAGEQVLDVQPKLAARVRLLNTGAVNKNDPNDARSVAVAALRSPDIRTVAACTHCSATSSLAASPSKYRLCRPPRCLHALTQPTRSDKRGSSSPTICWRTCDVSMNNAAQPSVG